MDEEWWVRRAVLALLLVVGIGTTIYAVVEIQTSSDTSAEAADESDGGDDTDGVEPGEPTTPVVSEGPLRTGTVLVVGRHGSPVARPPHTRESYELAVTDGVDYLQTEVVSTQDGGLVALHDNELSAITDVAERPEFADRETTKTVGGEEVTGWFSEDFTLDEVLTLRAVEPDPELRPLSAAYDGRFEILAFEDVLTLVDDVSRDQGREIGLFVEPRRAAYFRDIGLALERPLGRALGRSTLIDTADRVVVESTDDDVLERLDDQLGDDILTSLVVTADDAERLEADALDELADAVDAVSVETGAFPAGDADGAFDLVDRVHDAGLAMGVWPISFEGELLAPGFRDKDDPDGPGDLQGQVDGLVLIGVDVIFAESPLEVVEALAP